MSKVKKTYNIDNLGRISEDNRKTAMSAILLDARNRILKKKHGSRRGLLCATPSYDITEKDINDAAEEAKREIAPFARIIDAEIRKSPYRFLEGVWGDAGCREYLVHSIASSQGKKGGNQKGMQRWHTVWLDKAMMEIKLRCDDGLEAFTVTSYFTELLNNPDIDGDDDDGKLVFRNSILEDMGHTEGRKEPSISKNMVEKALTRLNKVS